ncbi:MAG TPA: hypothetical protein VFQ61_24775 [Polyangiaceae bacterium]|nr:hypothetical protein [Polyangiaceae bacterium]
MPAPIGPLLGLALGGAFAWVLNDGSTRGKAALTLPPLALVCCFTLLIFAPAAAYFIAFEPDWAYAYFVDSSQRLGPLDTFALLADVTSVPGGFLAVLHAARGPTFSVLLRWIGLPLLVSILFLVILFPRLSVYATYAQFHGDFGTRPVSGSPLGYALIWITFVVACAAAWTAHSLKRMR